MNAALSAVSSSALVAVLVASTSAIALGFAFLWWTGRRRARELERLLREERRNVEDAARASDHFFDLVSHELRSPIAAIVGYQELLSDGVYGDVGHGASEPLDRIRRAAEHLLHLVDGVIDLARLRAGSLAPQPERVDLDELLHDMARDFERGANERGLAHEVHIAAPMPTIRSDPQRLQRALHLMVVIAEKYPDPDGRPLELDAQRAGDVVTVRIRGTRVPRQADAEDLVVRTGIRIAVIAAMADLLGGALHLQSADDHAITEIALEVVGF
jgi:signal transduction histidine kinase